MQQLTPTRQKSQHKSPTRHKSLSQDIIPDYKLFQIEPHDGSSKVVTVIEVKTKDDFNDNLPDHWLPCC